jgi:hypothetical protein
MGAFLLPISKYYYMRFSVKISPIFTQKSPSYYANFGQNQRENEPKKFSFLG